ncbi:Ig-like domain-containing protein [Arsenicibacter rosenii]|nr:Ig-like domain-containing protein [Arsenicibacter rosenii]
MKTHYLHREGRVKHWWHVMLTLLFLTIGHSGISFGLDAKSGQSGTIVSMPEYGITGLTTSAVVDETSSWQYTVRLTRALEYKRRRTNAAMQRSAAQATVSGNTPPDTTPPDTTLTSNPPNPTNSSSATFTFTGSDNVTAPGNLTYEVQLDGTGFSSGASPKTYTGLADGPHTFQVRAVDEAGNPDPTPASYTWNIDTTPPPAPVVIAPANGSKTNNNKPTVRGTAEANISVTILIDGTSVGTVTANAGGKWMFTLSNALADGSHTAKARATDDAGNTSVDSNTNTFTVDTTAPPAPVVSAPANGSRTNNNKPTVSGTAEAGSTVTVTIDNTDIGTTTADASGNWTFTISSALSDGSHTAKARATDDVGNTGPDSNTNTFTVDTTAPPAPVLSAPANGAVLSSARPTVSGTAEAGSTVTVTIDNTDIGTTTANASGNWSYTINSALSEGAHTVKARATDDVGNTGIISSTNSFTIAAVPVVSGFASAGASVCEGTPLTLTATVSNVTGSYAYTLTNGSSPLSGTSAATTFSQALNGVSPGNYTYTLTVSSNGLSTTATTSVSVGSQPAVSSVSAGGVLGNGTCSVALSGIGVGSSFVVTGPNGFVYSTVYRQAGAHTVTIPAVTTPGTYTMTASSGNCSAAVQTVVTGTACR